MVAKLKVVGQNQDFERIDFFDALVVCQKQRSFALNGRRDLQRIRQAYCVTSADERRCFG